MANEKATYKGVTYSNGNLPKKFRKALAGQSNAYLRSDAADAWNAAREEALKETGVLLTVRGWDRTISEQRKFFLQRYERSEEHTSELQSRENLVCRLLREKECRDTGGV